MIIFSVIIFLIGIVLLIAKTLNNKSEEGMLSLMFTTGISLIVSSSPDFWSNIVAIVALIKNQPNIANSSIEFNIVTFIVGIILVVISFLTYLKQKNKLCILNINGYKKYSVESYMDSKKIMYYYKEREINFIDIYNKIFKKNKDNDSCECILNQLEENVKAFRNESNGLKRGYTGIAPIPFIVYAGTFLDRLKIDKYLEYNKNLSNYYESDTKTKIDYPKLELESNINELDVSIKEVTLVISLTQRIQNNDIKQFISKSNIVRLGVKNNKDNVINSVSQLKDYVNTIFDTIILVTNKLENITRINLILSSQSCLALEIGKRCVDDTRLPQIVSYQYENQNKVKYPWGIIVNGSMKKKLVKEE